MRRLCLLCALLLCTALGGCTTTTHAARSGPSVSIQAASPAPADTADGPTVILVSLDGYRADYLDRGLNPILQRIAADGVRARWLTPSFPTVTEPNHYTFLTGRYPDHNGIVDNDMADRDVQPEHFRMGIAPTTENRAWWDEATPLWVSMQLRGIRTAELSWPSGYVAIDNTHPALLCNGAKVGTPEQETAELIHWLDLPPVRRPRFLMVHYELIDAMGHRYGPDSRQLDDALRTIDQAMGQLVDALQRNGQYTSTDLVIVSDHGMAELSPARRIYLDDIIDMHAVSTISLGGGAGIDPRHSAAGRAAEAALLQPYPHLQCWRKHDLPERLHYGSNPRVPAVVCLATPGWLVTTHAEVARRTFELKGTHGYDNLAPAMRAIFIAHGPSFRREYVSPAFPNVDVYPLLAHIFGIKPETNDGKLSDVMSLLKQG